MKKARKNDYYIRNINGRTNYIDYDSSHIIGTKNYMIYNCLFEWQKKIVNKYKNRNSFGLYLDMGLGKTIISLAFAEQNICSKILVITLKNKVLEKDFVEGSWLYWQKKLDLSYNINIKNHKKIINDNDFYIINYESLFKRNKSLKQEVILNDGIKNFISGCKNQNVAIIIDECHKMKNLQSVQTKSIYKIKKNLELNHNSVFCYLLSGTPFTSGYIDLYSQLKFLGFSHNKEWFKENFCIMGHNPFLPDYAQPIIAYKNEKELYKIIHNFALTIKSEEVIDLPEKIFVNHELPRINEFTYFTKTKLKASLIRERLNKLGLNELLTDKNKDILINNPFYRNLDYPDSSFLCKTISEFRIRCRELSIGFMGNRDKYIWYNKDRFEELKNLLSNEIDNYILFYNYVPELLELYSLCEGIGYNIDVYCGDIKSLDNYEKYKNQNEEQKFNNKKNIILINYSSGSSALNFQGFNKCILFSLPSFKDYQQGIKRIHRIGQTKTCIYHIFYQDNFLDKNMIKSLNNNIEYDDKLFEKDLAEENSYADLH